MQETLRARILLRCHTGTPHCIASHSPHDITSILLLHTPGLMLSPSYPLTHPLTEPPTHPLTLALTYPLTHSHSKPPTHPLTHSHSPTLQLTGLHPLSLQILPPLPPHLRGAWCPRRTPGKSEPTREDWRSGEGGGGEGESEDEMKRREEGMARWLDAQPCKMQQRRGRSLATATIARHTFTELAMATTACFGASVRQSSSARQYSSALQCRITMLH